MRLEIGKVTIMMLLRNLYVCSLIAHPARTRMLTRHTDCICNSTNKSWSGSRPCHRDP